MAEPDAYPRAEEALRLLAGAAGAARLYPASSPMHRDAAAKFTERANLLASHGPLRYIIDPHGFRVGEAEIAPGQSQVVGLAEALHAMQAGQLVVAPGVTIAETQAFIGIANAEVAAVRAAGGLRAALVAAGVQHIAVIEVSLRASDESGLAGIDLTSAPLDEIAELAVAAVELRAQRANEGPAGDEMADAIARLEDATRGIAMERVAAAMMRLDDTTRQRVLALSLKTDTVGNRMDGMLAAIAQMKPAALARLLTLMAAQAGTDPRRIATALPLPPETAKLLALMLAPTPNVEPDFGIEPVQHAREMAAEVCAPADTTDLERQVAIASPQLSAGRALATAVSVSRVRLDADTVRGIGEVLPQAARDGSFATVREALRRLDEIALEPSLADDVVAARSTLADPAVLADVCRAPVTDADAAIAGEIIAAAGSTGAEALLDAYIRLPEANRSLLRPVMRGMSEGILGVARARLRRAEPATATAIVRALPVLGDKRAIAVIADGLNHLDESVRFASASALAVIPAPEATAALVRAIGHREPETQRYAVRMLGQTKAAAAVPALSRALEDISTRGRTYETRKEIIRALEEIGTPEAERALRKFANRTLGLRKKTRELKSQAVHAADSLADKRGVDGR